MRAADEGLDRAPPALEAAERRGRLAPLRELLGEFLHGAGAVTRTASHVRDGFDLKRLMGIVVVALLPCVGMAVYNTGYQASRAVALGVPPLDDWRATLFAGLGGRFDPGSPLLCCLYGALYFLPMLAACFFAVVAVEATTAALRQRPMSESFLVIGVLLPLTLPPAMPLWQVALGAAFGVLFGKEVFGGTGMNFLNPVLVAWVFLFFAYPAELSGDGPWIAADFVGVDGFSGATLLARAATEHGAYDAADWWQAFLGRTPGAMGETSALACMLGAVVLILTRVAAWRTMAAVVLGTLVTTRLFNGIGSESNPMFAVPFHWHVVTGSWALGTVFLATDPVSSSFTDAGRWVYGFGIGALTIFIRVLNPAYPEGIVFAILLMSTFAPLIDFFVVRANIRRRVARDDL
jgi:Na+-transporting NADH:ubiquinone oxidoreductase subunit B